jgi:chitodextrinase
MSNKKLFFTMGLSFCLGSTVLAQELFSPKVYDKPDNIVRYYEALDDSTFMVADFKNKYWVDGSLEKPSFYPKDSAWKIITKVVTTTNEEAIKEGKAISSIIYVPEYHKGSAYVGGMITRIENSCYKSAWWTTDSPLENTQVWKEVACPTGVVTLPALTIQESKSEESTVNEDTSSAETEEVTEVVSNSEENITECINDIPEWNENGIYLAGNVVRYEGKIYKTRWWTKGDIPSKKVENIWDKPWIEINKCPSVDLVEEVEANETRSGIPADFTPEPVVVDPQESTEDELVKATKEAEEKTKETDSPVIPPVVIDDEPVKATKIASDVPKSLPDGEYEFLHLVTQEDWDWMFPLRSGKYVPTTPCAPGEFLNCGGATRNDGSGDTFTLDNFIKAVLEYNAWAKANNYKQFLNEGTLKQQAQEFLIFWAKSSRETSGSWATAKEPWIVTQKIGNEEITAWKGGLYWVEEVGYSTDPETGMSSAINYVDSSSTLYPPAPGRSYYGRGIIQLSWNYNYGAFSYWLYDNGLFKDIIDTRDKLLKFPNLVADNGALSIMSGIWFWMTPQGAKPSAHDVVYGDVYNISKSTQEQGLPQSNFLSIDEIPVAKGETTDQSVFAYRLGTVINIVNGGLECNKAAKWHGGPVQRVMYYDAYAAYFNNKYNLNVNRIDAAKASSKEAWTQHISDSSMKDLQSATCYNQKSYYGW